MNPATPSEKISRSSKEEKKSVSPGLERRVTSDRKKKDIAALISAKSDFITTRHLSNLAKAGIKFPAPLNEALDDLQSALRKHNANKNVGLFIESALDEIIIQSNGSFLEEFKKIDLQKIENVSSDFLFFLGEELECDLDSHHVGDRLVESTIKNGKIFWRVIDGHHQPLHLRHLPSRGDIFQENKTWVMDWTLFNLLKNSGKRTGTVEITESRFVTSFVNQYNRKKISVRVAEAKIDAQLFNSASSPGESYERRARSVIANVETAMALPNKSYFKTCWQTFSPIYIEKLKKDFKTPSNRTVAHIKTILAQLDNDIEQKKIADAQSIWNELRDKGILNHRNRFSHSWRVLPQQYITLTTLPKYITYQNIVAILYGIADNEDYKENIPNSDFFIFRKERSVKSWSTEGLVKNKNVDHPIKQLDVSVYGHIKLYTNKQSLDHDHIPSEERLKHEAKKLSSEWTFSQQEENNGDLFWTMALPHALHTRGNTYFRTYAQQMASDDGSHPFLQDLKVYFVRLDDDYKSGQITVTEYIEYIGAFRHLYRCQVKFPQPIDGKTTLPMTPHLLFRDLNSLRQMDEMLNKKIQSLLNKNRGYQDETRRVLPFPQMEMQSTQNFYDILAKNDLFIEKFLEGILQSSAVYSSMLPQYAIKLYIQRSVFNEREWSHEAIFYEFVIKLPLILEVVDIRNSQYRIFYYRHKNNSIMVVKTPNEQPPNHLPIIKLIAREDGFFMSPPLSNESFNKAPFDQLGELFDVFKLHDKTPDDVPSLGEVPNRKYSQVTAKKSDENSPESKENKQVPNTPEVSESTNPVTPVTSIKLPPPRSPISPGSVNAMKVAGGSPLHSSTKSGEKNPKDAAQVSNKIQQHCL